LLRACATVLATARTRPDRHEPDCVFVAADITTTEGCATVANAVMEELGGIDIIVHAACACSCSAGV
jgi:NAD(P)-dependent dehydrogenase (short-subunit alcohol dehydrogenase family)